MSADNWGLIGHQWAVNLLRQHIANQTVRHAYLFTGSPGLGRRTLALRFAQALNCTQPPEPGLACDLCRDCKQFAAMQHPDLSVVQAEREGAVLQVDQVRELQRSFAYKPYQSRYRVAIFLRFQEANLNAANALLKTLEEAPAYAVIILTADTPEQLLPTILSRCEILRLRPLPIVEVASFLKSHSAASAQAELLAHISGGRPGYALRLSKQPEALEFRADKLKDLEILLSASRIEKFAYAEKLAKDKESMRQTLQIWQSFWRDVLLKTSGASVPIANIDFGELIEQAAAKTELAGARRLVSQMEHAVERLDKNINPKLLAEVITLDLPA